MNQINDMFKILFQNFPGDMDSRQIYYGVGSPESNVAAGPGAMFFRTDASAGAALYIKESGTGNTGWQVVDTASQTIPLSRGGTGQALSDPDADRILFWDDSEGKIDFLAPNTNLAISGTNLNNTLTDTNTSWIHTTVVAAEQPATTDSELFLMPAGTLKNMYCYHTDGASGTIVITAAGASGGNSLEVSYATTVTGGAVDTSNTDTYTVYDRLKFTVDNNKNSEPIVYICAEFTKS